MFIGEKKETYKNCFDVSSITLAELTPDLRFVADKCGLEFVVTLLKQMQGTTIYVPKVAHLKQFAIRYIRENIKKTIKELAIELSVSENFIRNIKYDLGTTDLQVTRQ